MSASQPDGSDVEAGQAATPVRPEELELASGAKEAAAKTSAQMSTSQTLVQASESVPEPSSDESAGEQATAKLQLQRRQQLEHHLKFNPTDLDGFLELGRIYRSQQRPLEARRVLQQALQIFPDEQELLWELEEATLARSLQQLREVVDLANRLDTAETERELDRCRQDWARRRIDVCRARLKRDPSLMHLRLSLAEALHDTESYAEAINELEPVLDIDEFSPAAYLIQARCLLAAGKDLEAMACLRACAMRRAVVAPLRIRVVALRLLCETAERLGIAMTLAHYRAALQQAEREGNP